MTASAALLLIVVVPLHKSTPSDGAHSRTLSVSSIVLVQNSYFHSLFADDGGGTSETVTSDGLVRNEREKPALTTTTTTQLLTDTRLECTLPFLCCANYRLLIELACASALLVVR